MYQVVLECCNGWAPITDNITADSILLHRTGKLQASFAPD